MKNKKIVTLDFIRRMTDQEDLTLEQARELSKESQFVVVKDAEEIAKLQVELDAITPR